MLHYLLYTKCIIFFQTGVTKMSQKKILLTGCIGFIIGYVTKELVNKSLTKITPEKALQNAKETFEKQGPITGLWIFTKPERLHLNDLIYGAYRGGISRNIDGVTHQYEFYSDIDTGAILHTAEKPI